MEINFGGVPETVVTREEFPLKKAKKTLNRKTIAVLGYGSQGPGQSQNLRDNGFDVIVGQRQESPTWEKAVKDGWIPGKTLFSLEDAAKRGDVISYLLSDASQPIIWPKIKNSIEGKTLYVSHGFPIHFSEHTGIVPSKDTDIVMIAPKGAGLSVRKNFLNGSGINASYAVHQNNSGKALDTTLAMGIGIGAGYLFETTIGREVVSDHVGERAILLGELWALAETSNEALRAKGMNARDAFINSSEQLTQVILPLIGSGGDKIYSKAIKAGQLGTVIKYQEMIRNATLPIMGQLYDSCVKGIEAKIALESNSKHDYRKNLEEELSAIEGSEMWKMGVKVRTEVDDRNYGLKLTNFALAGAVIGAMESQYQTLINNDHSPSESANETVEETTQSLNQFYQANGVAYLLGVCSTTAQRGALDWGPRFKKVLAPVFASGKDSYGVEDISRINKYTSPDMWDVCATVRELRPENQAKA